MGSEHTIKLYWFWVFRMQLLYGNNAYVNLNTKDIKSSFAVFQKVLILSVLLQNAFSFMKTGEKILSFILQFSFIFYYIGPSTCKYFDIYLLLNPQHNCD